VDQQLVLIVEMDTAAFALPGFKKYTMQLLHKNWYNNFTINIPKAKISEFSFKKSTKYKKWFIYEAFSFKIPEQICLRYCFTRSCSRFMCLAAKIMAGSNTQC
jgi:hypothetical protein